jgi:hypothetical protein
VTKLSPAQWQPWLDDPDEPEQPPTEEQLERLVRGVDELMRRLPGAASGLGSTPGD